MYNGNKIDINRLLLFLLFFILILKQLWIKLCQKIRCKFKKTKTSSFIISIWLKDDNEKENNSFVCFCVHIFRIRLDIKATKDSHFFAPNSFECFSVCFSFLFMLRYENMHIRTFRIFHSTATVWFESCFRSWLIKCY